MQQVNENENFSTILRRIRRKNPPQLHSSESAQKSATDNSLAVEIFLCKMQLHENEYRMV
jgi:hypothetical protein